LLPVIVCQVYAGNGCQIIPPADEDIAASILEHSGLWDLGGPGQAQSPQDLAGHPLVSGPLQRVQQAYWERLQAGLRYNPPVSLHQANAMTDSSIAAAAGATLGFILYRKILLFFLADLCAAHSHPVSAYDCRSSMQGQHVSHTPPCMELGSRP
jgi:hypothetical protein